MMNVRYDERDEQLRQQRIVAWNKRTGPRVGDFVRFSDGHLHRFSHDWGEDIQHSHDGSFYLTRNGYGSFSGGLDQPIDKAQLRDTGAVRNGRFWFFHHDVSGAHRGVDVYILCRVYEYFGPRPTGMFCESRFCHA